jgi:hypothetical protein
MFVNNIALTTGAIGCGVGYILLVPGLMCFDTQKLNMNLLGVASLSIIPVSIIATTSAIATQNLLPLGLYTIPINGMITSFIIG